MTQTHILFNKIPQTLEYPKKSSSKLNLLLTKPNICVPFKRFFAAFDKPHSHGHSGEKLSFKTFFQFFYTPRIPLWFSIFIHDCIECQMNNNFLLNPIIFLPLYHFVKMLLFLIIECQWTQKDRFCCSNPAPHVSFK